MLEMTAASALMRLMSEKGKESQQDRYVRIKEHPNEFEEEMLTRGLMISSVRRFISIVMRIMAQFLFKSK